MPQRFEPNDIQKITSAGKLTDISVKIRGKEVLMLGPAGQERELAFLSPTLNSCAERDKLQQSLPVLLGSGLGYALDALIEHLKKVKGNNFRLAIIDKEESILTASELKNKYPASKNIIWISEQDTKLATNLLSKWQSENDGIPFYCLSNPFYLRLDRDYYSQLRSIVEASEKADFWNRASYQKFKQEPRILLLTSSYFLIGDLEAACKRMGLAHQLLTLPEGEVAASSFIEQLLENVITFKPDFILTINHLGVDREGILQDLLKKLCIPLASWFVDNPHLILYKYKNVISPWTTVFTWDADNVNSLKDLGFEHVCYLPLATDHKRFAPMESNAYSRYRNMGWESRVSFVGNSMLYKVEGRLKSAKPSKILRNAFPQIASNFAESDERSVYTFMQKEYPELIPEFFALETTERQLSFETLITWEATMRYRLACVKATLPFSPLIAGDDGWLKLLANEPHKWKWHKELSYYSELPYFYPFSEVSFNCTSKQMKGAVNQRVFDVPATESFVITDWREQLENLFEPEKEVICYHSPEEATELISYYLQRPKLRLKISQAARKRILSEHLYEHRLKTIIKVMRNIYA